MMYNDFHILIKVLTKYREQDGFRTYNNRPR